MERGPITASKTGRLAKFAAKVAFFSGVTFSLGYSYSVVARALSPVARINLASIESIYKDRSEVRFQFAEKNFRKIKFSPVSRLKEIPLDKLRIENQFLAELSIDQKPPTELSKATISQQITIEQVYRKIRGQFRVAALSIQPGEINKIASQSDYSPALATVAARVEAASYSINKLNPVAEITSSANPSTKESKGTTIPPVSFSFTAGPRVTAEDLSKKILPEVQASTDYSSLVKNKFKNRVAASTDESDSSNREVIPLWDFEKEIKTSQASPTRNTGPPPNSNRNENKAANLAPNSNGASRVFKAEKNSDNAASRQLAMHSSEYPKDYSTSVAHSEKKLGIQFYEAFSSRAIQDGSVQSEVFSYEGRASKSGWYRTSASGYVETLYYMPPNTDAFNAELLGDNSKVLLGSLSGISQSEDAGILFGRIRKNWIVEIPTRTDQIIYLGKDLGVLDVSEISRAKYFAALNVRPGSQVVRIVDRKSGESAAMVAPVIGGIATYVDLTDIKKKQLKGEITWFEADESFPVDEARVRLIGYDNKVSFTSTDGKFNLGNILTIAGHPMFLDVDHDHGYTHRYKIDYDSKFTSLPFFTESYFDHLVGQAEGARSDLGYVVSLGEPDSSKAKLEAGVAAVAGSPMANTYGITLEDYLSKGSEMNSLRPWALSVNLRPGMNKALVKTGLNRVVWSSIIVADQDVISVIFPE